MTGNYHMKNPWKKENSAARESEFDLYDYYLVKVDDARHSPYFTPVERLAQSPTYREDPPGLRLSGTIVGSSYCYSPDENVLLDGKTISWFSQRVDELEQEIEELKSNSMALAELCAAYSTRWEDEI